VDRLLLVGGRVPVVHQEHVDADPVAEAQQFEVPVIPPARVLLSEQQHQDDGQEDDAAVRSRR
jgi:hypothetical protein